MTLTLKQLFEANIIREDDDLVIKQDGKIVVDNRKFISDELKNYIDYPIERMYSMHGTKIGNEAIFIRISSKEVSA